MQTENWLVQILPVRLIFAIQIDLRNRLKVSKTNKFVAEKIYSNVNVKCAGLVHLFKR